MRLRHCWLGTCSCVLALSLSAALLSPAGASALQSLTTGFSADPLLTGSDAGARAAWIPRAVSEQAGIVRVNVTWSAVAPPIRPPGFVASDPASPGYDWGPVDAAVRDLSIRGLQVLLNVALAPTWAEGGGRPAGAAAGTWRPSASQFASFATAAAARYGGSFPDPLHPDRSLPRVRYWQAWNEPNLDTYLSPQWTGRPGHYASAAPALYRSLLNAFYTAVKRVQRSNFVVMAGTAPYGDAPGGHRTQPVAFDRTLFCLRGDTRLMPTQCHDPAHLDAVSHHPYGIGGPLWHALNPDDAAVPDLYKIARVLRTAERNGHVLPRGHKRLWDTEISWDSSPPDPQGVPLALHARWVEQALYVLWRQGVDTVLWLQIADSPPHPSYAATYQAGMYFLDGRPKPAATALRFPFVTSRLSATRVRAWGRSPSAGSLAIEGRQGGHWKVLSRIGVRGRQVFQTRIAVRRGTVLRAVVGSQVSLSWPA